tara:strand:- start:163318 stop:163566 length:249 start_codon:yes stop_codon:yes gene_type:complete
MIEIARTDPAGVIQKDRNFTSARRVAIQFASFDIRKIQAASPILCGAIRQTEITGDCFQSRRGVNNGILCVNLIEKHSKCQE